MKRFDFLIKRLLILVLNTGAYFIVAGQDTEPARNFPGIFAGIEWNTISGSWGLEYERIFYTKNQVTAGAKVSYIAKYEYGNLELLSGSNCCETAKHGILVVTGSYFTSRRKHFTGFFLHSGLGAGITLVKSRYQTSSTERSRLRPAFEFGPGLQFNIAETFFLKWKGTASFGPFKGSFTSTTLSLGFY